MMARLCGGLVILVALLLPRAGAAQAVSVTANAGWSSEYFYRGIPQKASSASVGIAVEVGRLSFGAWGADVGDGNEVDLYGGYGVEFGALSLSAGGTAYLYTGEFDDTYLETNLGVGAGPLSVEFSIGRYDTQPLSTNYWFLGITAEHRGLYTTVGSFGDGLDGEYLQVGYGFTASELDLTIDWIVGMSDDVVGRRDQTLTLGVSKTFDVHIR